MRAFCVLIILAALGTFVSGCSYNTYYHEDGSTGLPPGTYKVEKNVPIRTEQRIERNYVVE
ncbi:MAG: hypothetical protein AB1454_10950 [Candidatus Auribacterota bacterium]|jgi:hypothetical protein|uniref:Uncharacterized protein n=1 Tax=Candidatus Auribacter fodinae TaxID=2093366 RepID=A0A3A4QVU8_9BACT|nr:MAG: hypothetical protein C4541_08590 [Candidatus Auribacter fodinae]